MQKSVSVWFVLLLLVGMIVGCVSSDRLELERDISSLESGMLSMGFDIGHDGANGFRMLIDRERDIVLTALRNAKPLNREQVVTDTPQLVVRADKDRIGFINLSSVEGEFSVSFRMYALNPRSNEWREFRYLFDHELIVRKLEK